MKPECAVCLLRVYIEAAKVANVSEAVQEKSAREVCFYLSKNFSLAGECASMGTGLDKLVKKSVGNPDQYKEKKEQVNAFARELAGKLKPKNVEEALRMALAGNALDFAHLSEEEMRARVKKILEGKLDIDESEKAAKMIAEAKRIVYVLDNAGEIYFDKLLLELLKEKDVRIVVREKPVLNDATFEDLKKAKMQVLAREVVQYPAFGYDVPEEGLYIAKGMAAYVSLSELDPAQIIYVLNVKCKPVADSLKVPVGASVIKAVG
ncbi:MAG: ARMT1-like domain-containing protein [Candidatus Micrarchaeota archaeon]